MTLRRVPAPRLSAHGARAASPLPHMRCDGREATPPRRVSSATFGGDCSQGHFPFTISPCLQPRRVQLHLSAAGRPSADPVPRGFASGVNLHSDRKCHRRAKSGSGPSDVWCGSLRPGAQRCWDMVFLHSGQERAAPKASGKRDSPGGPPREASSLGVRETSSCRGRREPKIRLLSWKAALALRS